MPSTTQRDTICRSLVHSVQCFFVPFFFVHVLFVFFAHSLTDLEIFFVVFLSFWWVFTAFSFPTRSCAFRPSKNYFFYLLSLFVQRRDYEEVRNEGAVDAKAKNKGKSTDRFFVAPAEGRPVCWSRREERNLW